jgi:hypothetical protein
MYSERMDDVLLQRPLGAADSQSASATDARLKARVSRPLLNRSSRVRTLVGEDSNKGTERMVTQCSRRRIEEHIDEDSVHVCRRIRQRLSQSV